MKKTYNISVDCANCALKMEEAAGKVPGVREALVNFMLQRMIVEFEEGADQQKVMQEVVKKCRRATSDGEIFL